MAVPRKNTEARSARATLRDRVAGVEPLIFAAGAVVVGAIVAAFVPRSAAETRLLAPVGRQFNAAATSLGGVAGQALSTEVAKVPIVGQVVAEHVDQLVQSVVQPA